MMIKFCSDYYKQLSGLTTDDNIYINNECGLETDDHNEVRCTQKERDIKMDQWMFLGSLLTLNWLEVEYEVERVIVIRHLGAQAAHVEVVLDVVVVDLSKELVASQVAEPVDPEGVVVPLRGTVVFLAVRIQLLCGSKRTSSRESDDGGRGGSRKKSLMDGDTFGGRVGGGELGGAGCGGRRPLAPQVPVEGVVDALAVHRWRLEVAGRACERAS
jgi:hypothetical protein